MLRRELVAKAVHDSGVPLKGLVMEMSPRHLERVTRIGDGGENTPAENEVLAKYTGMLRNYKQWERG